ncbi:Smr/MutS family protein [Marinifilum caeruleilacunae]|uniref:DUF2027 domain-containing protein n=1 Tax=Marinifilum caeruleilacunae TaxID=2499076 RepID=A0ABX1WT82_9BACT|nr:DUF2027 domain-containing protein [Marinifilum caeruleilacunae]NOU59212.1 DUF2027 domain-containing protein [Marinifilum caeruleilacunae]
MQINIGDKVRFLNDIGGGIVTKILDAKTVMVLNEEDEFEIPSLKKNLVVVESASGEQSSPQQTAQISQENGAVSKPSQKLTIEKEDVYIAFAPREGYNPTESPLELYLINDTNHILLYGFYDQKGNKMEGQTAGNLDPKTKILLNEYDLKELNELSSCFFQILFYKPGESDIKKPLERNLKIQPVKFYKSSSYKETPYFHQDVILHKLTGEDLEHKLDELSQKEFKKVMREKESSGKLKSKPASIKGKDDIIEVDLHINALIDSVTGLSNADILEFQLNKFHEVMRQYQSTKGKRIVFIHGIGNGTLKKKVHDELRRKYKKHYQQDASFKEYGWGATMVTIR